MHTSYEPSVIEKDAQDFWSDHRYFEVKEDLSQEKFYCLAMLPYPSGDLHMGHVRNYSLADVIARHQTMLGKNVLHPMGWDAFGLPAENAAIKHELPPAEWTRKNIKRMRKQLQSLGLSIDWKREIATCDPSYYHWEQWLFVQLFKKGLVYRKDSVVNWDPVDQTVLANEQVVDGKGWRSGAPVEQREIPQWFFKITHYAEELLEGLNTLTGWPEQVRTMQRNWIGRSEGVTVSFPIDRRKSHLDIYTTRLDTLMGATYVAIAPDHPLALDRAKKKPEIEKFIKKCRKTRVAEADLATQEKLGIHSGLYALHPITEEKLPIWITNFVLMDYGSGAVMSVPAHDQRDFEFAQQYDLPIKQVIAPAKNTEWDFTQAAFTEPGVLINSSKRFDGLKAKKAIDAIFEWLEKKKLAKRSVQYRLRDWGISRQRYWGAPIPIIYCKECGAVPVPEQDLPVVLPEDLIPKGEGSPLAKCTEFYKTKCPECGKSAKRETDTMDTFVESSWYYARYCCQDQDKIMLDDRAKYWTPVDQYVGGIEHAVMHLLYARFMHKVLRDEGLLNSDEPFTRLLTQGMVLKDGDKMSKSKGNVVAPTPLIKKYGSDTVRLFMIFAAPPEQSLEWSDSGIEGAHRFLNKLWNFAERMQPAINELNQQLNYTPDPVEDEALQKLHHQIHSALKQADHDYQRQQYNTVVSACMKILNTLSEKELRTDKELQLAHEGLSILLRLLAPITPHITHYLWRELGYGNNILDSGWPRVNQSALQLDMIEVIIQINGKLRGKITVPHDSDEDTVKNLALGQEVVQKYIAEKPIKKTIIVPNRLINIVV